MIRVSVWSDGKERETDSADGLTTHNIQHMNILNAVKLYT